LHRLRLAKKITEFELRIIWHKSLQGSKWRTI
jgi:hypothetical protein